MTTPRCLLPWLAVLVFAFTSLAHAVTTVRVSVASDSAQGDGTSSYPSISADGRYVAFFSAATNLVPDDTNGSDDVFVHDLETGETVRVSVASDSAQGDGSSYYPSISADGRYVAFDSLATNLAGTDTNSSRDVFVHDLETGETVRVSVASDSAQGDGTSHVASISADGRYVAFISTAENLVPEDTNTHSDVFVHDRATGQTERVSVASDGTQGDLMSYGCAISADGRYVAFSSDATNLVPNDPSGSKVVFVHDRATGQTDRVSTERSGSLAVSADGRYIAFDQRVGGEYSDGWDIFVRDRATGQTESVSVASDGTPAFGASHWPAISADGRYVAFWSEADNLVPGDTNRNTDVFVHDRATGQTERVSVASDGMQANENVGAAGISADGRYVAFISAATNLVPADTNGCEDAFVHDRLTFEDVPVGSWAFYETDACVSAGIVAGHHDGLYHPEGQATRAEMAVFVSRALCGGDENVPFGPTPPLFADVRRWHWAYDYVAYLAAQDVVQGYPNGYYRPDYEVDRGQMAVFIARGIADPTGEEGLADYQPPVSPSYPDVPANYWSYKHVEYLAEAEVVKGYPDGLYRPTATVTRDQMAVYIARAFGLL